MNEVKVFEKHKTKAEAEERIVELMSTGDQYEDSQLNLIESQGSFYIESGVPFVRMGETSTAYIQQQNHMS